MDESKNAPEHSGNLTGRKMSMAQAMVLQQAHALKPENLDTSVQPDYEAQKQRVLEEQERLERNSSAKTRNPMRHLTPKKKKRR